MYFQLGKEKKQQGLSRGKGLDLPLSCAHLTLEEEWREEEGLWREEEQPASSGGLWGQSVLELEEGMGIIGMHIRGGGDWSTVLPLYPPGIPRNGLGLCESSQGSVSSIPCSITAPHPPSILRQCVELD